MIRWGILGCGNIARRFAQGLEHVAAATLAAVWNRNTGKADAFAREFGGTACDSLEGLLNSDIDAVYIATPHTSHAQLAIHALAAGKHVLCEKPAAISAAEFDTVLAAARQHGKLFMEAMKPPFYPLYRKLRDHLATDPIGPVGFVRAGFANPGVPADHMLWNPDMAGGSLLDIGIYSAFLAVDWLGPVQEVQVLGRLHGGVDSFASVNVRHEAGIAQLYCGLDLAGSGDALLGGPGGHIVIHEKWWNPVRATIQYTDGRKVELEAPMSGSGLNYETAHFGALIEAGRLESPIVTHAHSRSMIELIDAARAGLGVVFPFEA
ncbi:Gfo/Idh/MocA family protein [Jeongeupia naejangsanensis]|uniref:Gfo/Idh/MocA family oxidoreductase n=1 Tax=Jeongeupia naejangsanensis TaxID=613195 RepID=A0ABS2BN93_9NEIS|nr:Gfo/Idh/MocA family oxidoreductase [Jeongeupia naejangsanensis]MBM3116543.1 Gfo/Idh/MocA family oxidoreductase [Jeongeupia naejangsanensis]